jgi:hypothetical protein
MIVISCSGLHLKRVQLAFGAGSDSDYLQLKDGSGSHYLRASLHAAPPARTLINCRTQPNIPREVRQLPFPRIRKSESRVLEVADNGLGLRDDPERLFEKFQRENLEDSMVGVGLGRAICCTAARVHGGDIRASTAPTGGARLEITLPVQMRGEPVWDLDCSARRTLSPKRRQSRRVPQQRVVIFSVLHAVRID